MFYLGLASALVARTDEPKYDESKVRGYSLPDPLLIEIVERVRDAQTWFSRRRPEILRDFETNVYGRTPKVPTHPKFEVVPAGWQALSGKAIRKLVAIHFSGNAHRQRMK